jgi:centromeric protein E
MDLLREGESNRHYASTTMNHVRSRSHTIFRLYVRSIASNFDWQRERDVITQSILNFVGLAGSEKIEIYDTQRKNSSSVSNTKTL